VKTKLMILVAMFALVVAACGGDTGETTTTAATTTSANGTDTTEGETTTTAQEAMIGEGRVVGMAFDVGGRGDLSFNDLAANAWDQAKEDWGIEGEELAPQGAEGEDREENLRLLAETGHELIIANGFAFAVNVGRVAQEFPETFFAITDDCPRDVNLQVIEQDNVACMLFAEEQGSFLVGAAAALKSESGTIGFIGGVTVPLIEKFQAGFEAGARHINPDIEILSQYLTSPPDFSGFFTPALGFEAATSMYEQGADVVFHAAGGSGLGMFQAAQEVSASTGTKLWGIGVDSDQYNTVPPELQEFVLTSMLKRVDVAVHDTIEAFLTDSWQSGANRFDLERGGVGYSTTGGFVDDIASQLDDLAAQIISGEIEVPEALS
jgi:basic membrane protein A